MAKARTYEVRVAKRLYHKLARQRQSCYFIWHEGVWESGGIATCIVKLNNRQK